MGSISTSDTPVVQDVVVSSTRLGRPITRKEAIDICNNMIAEAESERDKQWMRDMQSTLTACEDSRVES